MTVKHKKRKVALDLCCGLGGWAAGFLLEGWRVVGVDIADFRADYPGEFVQADLMTWEGWREIEAGIVVSSTPCEAFSRHSMPWTRKRNPPVPSLALWQRAAFIATQLDVPIVQENVRGAQPWVGRAKCHYGPYYLWGDVPALMPAFNGHTKQSHNGNAKSKRALIPVELARFLAKLDWVHRTNNP